MYQRDFDFITNNNGYKLSVVLMADSFFYAVLDNENTLIAHQSAEQFRFSDQTHRNILLEDKILKATYQSISVVVLPALQFQASSPNDALLATFPGMELYSNKIEKLACQSIYNYFGITYHQETLLQTLFGVDGYTLHSLLYILSSYYLGPIHRFMHLHVEQDHVYIYIQQNGVLQFYNTFSASSTADILYFVLATCKTSGFEPLSDQVTISGWIEKDSPLFTQLTGYLPEVKLIKDTDFRLHSSCNPSQYPHHYFVHLANALCAS